MPNCFQLIHNPGNYPATLQTVDEEICQNLELEWHPKHWACGWYDYIGFKLAMGRSFSQITVHIYELIQCDEQRPTGEKEEWLEVDYTMLRINHYLQEHYTSDAWYETKRQRKNGVGAGPWL